MDVTISPLYIGAGVPRPAPGATPLGWARHFARDATIALLSV
ncbi:hypothetical protein ACQP2P_23225 [Dactylosporangium sp. CA-139114]